MTKTLTLTNSATSAKEAFKPANPDSISMYVCGPTVYDRAHLGNARSAVVFDQLFRILRHMYGAKAVVYARNFTDIDDKIIDRAALTHPDMPSHQGVALITKETTDWYHQDMDALGVLRPTHEPRATAYVDEMIEDISMMIQNGGAYAANGHVFFRATDNPVAGFLSGRRELDDDAVHRIEPSPLKDHPADFVLWKPSAQDQPGWDSPWGRGRPGWHIECSAMSTRLLGLGFDIHGGGSDLIFPHHDNEISQAKCCHPEEDYARTWLHNGMITVNGQKMSKSLGNFTTVDDLRHRLPGGAIRLALLSGHYRASINWDSELEERSLRTWRRWAERAAKAPEGQIAEAVQAALLNDMNTAGAISEMHQLYRNNDAAKLRWAMDLMGLPLSDDRPDSEDINDMISLVVAARNTARAEKDYARSDALRDALEGAGIEISDGSAGTAWVITPNLDREALEAIL